MSSVIDLRDDSHAGDPTGDRGNAVSTVPARKLRLGWRAAAVDATATLASLLVAVRTAGIDPSYLVVLAAWPFALSSVGAFDLRNVARGTFQARSPWTAAARMIVVLAALAVLVPAVALIPAVLLTLLLAGLTSVGRWGLSAWVGARHRDGTLITPVLARGSAAEVAALKSLLASDPAQPFAITAVQVTEGEWQPQHGSVTLIPGGADPVDSAVRNGARVVAFVGRQPQDSAELRRLLWRLEETGIDAQMMPIVAPLATPEVAPIGVTGLPSLSFRGRDLGAEVGFTKVVADKLVAMAGLVALSPLLALIAVAITSTSPGPVLFRQTRVGRNGEHFTMLKFRTMVADAEARKAELLALNVHDSGTLFKIKQDPRITPVGRFLRKFSLDELPQLWNVVTGEMSLVGPRPPLPDEVANYPVDAHRRFRVRPGLTGLWQVNGRSDLDPIESARLDTHYVEHWSIGLDLAILAKTARVVLTGSGAY